MSASKAPVAHPGRFSSTYQPTRRAGFLHVQHPRCPCVSDHRPQPTRLHRHYLVPPAWGGVDEPDNRVELCATAHENLHYLLDLLVEAGPDRLVDVRGHSPYVRRLALFALNRYRARYGAWPTARAALDDCQVA